MDNSQIQDYIRNAISTGSSIDQIRQALLNAGWQASVIEPYLANHGNPATEVVQASPANIPTVTNTVIPNTQNIDDVAKSKKSILPKIAILLLVFGVILIAVFAVLGTLGKSIYVSPKTNFASKEVQNEQSLNLTKVDNPYRVFLYANFTVKGKPIGINNKLFDYNISLTDEGGNKVSTGNGSYDYHNSSSSSDNKTGLSIENSNISLPIKDFQIKNDGNYHIIVKLAVPDSLDSEFTLSNWNYQVKGKVLTPSPILIVSGFALVFVSVILLLIGRKKKPLTTGN
jgi:hypothetical protein